MNTVLETMPKTIGILKNVFTAFLLLVPSTSIVHLFYLHLYETFQHVMYYMGVCLHCCELIQTLKQCLLLMICPLILAPLS